MYYCFENNNECKFSDKRCLSLWTHSNCHNLIEMYEILYIILLLRGLLFTPYNKYVPKTFKIKWQTILVWHSSWQWLKDVGLNKIKLQPNCTLRRACYTVVMFRVKNHVLMSMYATFALLSRVWCSHLSGFISVQI